MKWLVCLMFVVGACSGAGIYDSLIITEVNDVSLVPNQGAHQSCSITVQFNAVAKKGTVNEAKFVDSLMTSANLTLSLGTYLRLNKLIINNKAIKDSQEMYEILCNQEQ